LDEPEVVQVLGTGTWQGTPYFVMQYVEGTDLASKLSGGFRFTLEDTRRLGAQAARALWAAAKKGIVHRDVKPANMILTRTGKLMLMDFGLARLVRDASAATRLTQAGTVLGTARYMSPEQARGDTCDHRSDIYSLGCVLYEMLAGSPPFTARDIVGLLHKHVHEQPKPLRSHCPDLPHHVEVAIMRCLAKQPAERYPSSMELVHDLETDPAAAASARRSTGFDPDASSGASRPATPPARASGVPLLPVLLVLGLLAAGGWYAWDRYIAPAQQRGDAEPEPFATASPSPEPGTEAPAGETTPTDDDQEQDAAATRNKPAPAQDQPAEVDRVGTLATYQEALVAEDWPTCWRAAHLLLQRWPSAAREARVRIPLHVAASPAGARVWREDREAGTSPCTILCEPGARGRLTVVHPGHNLASVELTPTLASSWRWAPQLAPVERLDWQAKLRGRPRGRIVATGSGPRAAAVVTEAGLCYIIDAHSGSRRPINLALDQLDLAAGPIAFRGQLFVLLHDRLLQIDERIGRVLWRWPAADDSRRFIDALVAGPDELVFRRTKLYTATTQGELVVLTIDAGDPVQLQRTWPGQRITAPVAVQSLDAAEGALVVPCDDRLQFYNSASHTQHSPLNPTFAFSTARPVREQPLVWRAHGLRAVLAADSGGNAHLIDARPDIDPVNRERGYWRLPGPPIHPPVALGDDRHAAVELANGRLAVLDLSDDGRVAWQRGRDNPLPTAAGQLATDGQTLLLATASGELIALAAADGAERWRVDLGAPLATGASLIADRILVASTGGVLLALTP
ncbi:MAG: protein kinase domain-containing protein, partial [Planctomycetota bacterium]